jgi:REP element-mobilizing transposase RayT
MARSLRVEYEGAFYHVMARGNRREEIFLDDDDRRFFLDAVAEVCGQTGWRVHAWVLMGNHYHLMIETPEANLVDGMKWLQNTYTRRFNVRHSKWGRVFGDRYKAVVVEAELPEYYGSLIDYIHLNPARAGIVRADAGQSILDYPWSSLAGGYALAPGKRVEWLAAAHGLEVLGYRDTTAGRRRMVEDLDRRVLEEGDRSGRVPLPAEVDARISHLRRGWYWGRQEFGEKLLGMLEARMGRARSRAYRRSPECLAHGLERAEELVSGGLEVAGLSNEVLSRLRGSDARKVALAKIVRERTTAPLGWVAKRLGMGGAANAGHYVRKWTWPVLWKRLPEGLCQFLKAQLE